MLNSFVLLLGPVRSNTSSTVWAVYSCCYHQCWKLFKHISITVQFPFTLGLRYCAYRQIVLPNDTVPHCSSGDPFPGCLDPKSQAITTVPQCPACTQCMLQIQGHWGWALPESTLWLRCNLTRQSSSVSMACRISGVSVHLDDMAFHLVKCRCDQTDTRVQNMDISQSGPHQL